MHASPPIHRFAQGKRLLVAGALMLIGAGAGLAPLGHGNAASLPSHAGSAAATRNETAASLIVEGDTIRPAEGLSPAEAPFLACTAQSRFPQGTNVMWRVRVVDPATEQALGPDALQDVTLTLADGTVLPLHPHPPTPDGDVQWRVTFSVPADYPTGVLDYTLTATSLDGRTGTLAPFGPVMIVPQGSR